MRLHILLLDKGRKIDTPSFSAGIDTKIKKWRGYLNFWIIPKMCGSESNKVQGSFRIGKCSKVRGTYQK